MKHVTRGNVWMLYIRWILRGDWQYARASIFGSKTYMFCTETEESIEHPWFIMISGDTEFEKVDGNTFWILGETCGKTSSRTGRVEACIRKCVLSWYYTFNWNLEARRTVHTSHSPFQWMMYFDTNSTNIINDVQNLKVRVPIRCVCLQCTLAGHIHIPLVEQQPLFVSFFEGTAHSNHIPFLAMTYTESSSIITLCRISRGYTQIGCAVHSMLPIIAVRA